MRQIEKLIKPLEIIEFLFNIKLNRVFSGRWHGYVNKYSDTQEVPFPLVIDGVISFFYNRRKRLLDYKSNIIFSQ